MYRECRERSPGHRLQTKPLVSDPGVHHVTCVTYVPWCLSGSLTRSGGESIPGACANRNLTYLASGPLSEPKMIYFTVAYIHHQTWSILLWYQVVVNTLSSRRQAIEIFNFRKSIPWNKISTTKGFWSLCHWFNTDSVHGLWQNALTKFARLLHHEGQYVKLTDIDIKSCN